MSVPLAAHLSPDHNIHVVLSVLSGSCKAQEYYDGTLKPFLDSHGVAHSVHITKTHRTIIELTNTIFRPNAEKGLRQTIILLSGDGGVIDIVDTLAAAVVLPLPGHGDTSESTVIPPTSFVRPALCLIPQGTANALAWSSGIAEDPLTVLLKGKAKPLPIFEAKFSPGTQYATFSDSPSTSVTTKDLNEQPQQLKYEPIGASDLEGSSRIFGAVVFSWCLHAALVHKSDTPALRQHGVERFKLAAQELMARNHAYHGRVLVRTESIPHQWTNITAVSPPANKANKDSSKEAVQAYSYVLATPISNLEQKFCISPSSSPLSGMFYLLTIPHQASVQRLSEIVMAAYDEGKHVQAPEVTYDQINRVRIELSDFTPRSEEDRAEQPGRETEEEENRIVCVDGKIVALPAGGWVEVQMINERVIDLVVPE